MNDTLTAGSLSIVLSEDMVLMNRALNKMAQRARDAGFSEPWKRSSAKGFNFDQFAADWSAMSFFGGEIYYISEIDTWKKTEFETLLAILSETSASSHVLILSGKSMDQRLSAVKKLTALGTVTAIPVPKRRDLPLFLVQLAKSDYALNISFDVASLMVDRTGDTPSELLPLLDQLALFLHPETTLSREAASQFLGQWGPANIFAWTRVLSEGNKKESGLLLDRLLEEGAEPMYLLAMLRRHYRILMILITLPKSASQAERAKAAGVHPFFLKDYDQELLRLNYDKLVNIYHRLSELDQRLKSEKTPAKILYQNFQNQM